MKSLSTLKNDPERLLTQGEVCALLGKSQSWAERSRWARTGPRYFKFGRAVRYRAADVLDYILASAVETERRTAA